jgi:AcrR family transcriptional regulator
MGRSGQETHARILAVAYGLFYRRGYGRVSMDAVAEAAGVTKRTVYQHFESKDALVGALLDRQQEEALRLVQGWGVAAGTESELIAGIFGGLARWAERPRWLGSGYTRLAMELADLPGHPARVIARRHKRAVEESLAARLEALGCTQPAARARELVLLIEGAQALMLMHGDLGYAWAALRAAERLAPQREAQDGKPLP